LALGVLVLGDCGLRIHKFPLGISHFSRTIGSFGGSCQSGEAQPCSDL
jgi:hypothetical protein